VEINEIKRYLAGQAEDVCRKLLSNGKRHGKEWVVGSVKNEPGNSLKVCLVGSKAGTWTDFSTSDKGGDLIDLWQQNTGQSLAETLDDIRVCYKLTNPSFHNAVKREYKKPEPVKHQPDNRVVNYLTQERKLTKETIEAFGVKSNAGAYYLPSFKYGELIGWKQICIQRGEKGKKVMHQSIGCKPIAFGWQAMDQDVKTLVIAEGEIDAMTWHQMGFPAISVPMGAGGGSKLDWIEHDFEELDRFEKIYIAFDDDDSGKESAPLLAERLGLHRCAIVTLPLKDANECLMAGHGYDVFKNALDNAKELSIGSLKSSEDFRESTAALFFDLDAQFKGDSFFLRPEEVHFRDSEFTVWSGTNGHGKSMLLGQVLLDLTLNQGRRFCIASMEMKGNRLLYRMGRQAMGLRNPSEGFFNAYMDEMARVSNIWDKRGQIDQEEMFKAFAYSRKKYGATHFVIDSLMKCGMGPDDYKGQKSFVDKICDFMSRYNVHVHLVAHNKKSESEHIISGKMDIAGTANITDAADNVISVWRNKKKEEKRNTDDYNPDDVDGFATVLKQRNGEWEGKIPLFFDPESYQYSTNPGLLGKRYIEYNEVF
jgi:twinkle protein